MIKASELTGHAVSLIQTIGPKLSELASRKRSRAPITLELILRLHTD